MDLTERGKIINFLALKRLSLLEGEDLFERGDLIEDLGYDTIRTCKRRGENSYLLPCPSSPLSFMCLPRKVTLAYSL